tara:strand:+ start:154 stop:855 length:702 start_codon:yes stop_codon:yes gene_type:complete
MFTKINIGIIGANGFVGNKFSTILEKENLNHEKVTRDNYDSFKDKNNFSHVINCAMPSGRFWSKNNPTEDFRETVLKTFNIKNDFLESKIIQISSISAKVQLDTVYGRNKRAAELVLDPQKDLIIRLGPIYDSSMKKGALIDIVNGSKVFVSGDTKYAFTPLDWACHEILNMKDKTGLFEVGSKNYIMLKDLRDTLNSNSNFEGFKDDQIFPDAGESCPDANDVIDFARKLVN